MERQVSLSILCGTLRIVSTVHSSDILMVLKNPRFKSYERIYNIDFSLSLKMKSLTILPELY